MLKAYSATTRQQSGDQSLMAITRNRVYLVMAVTESADVSTTLKAWPHDIESQGKVEMSWIDGQVGAIPVFQNKAKALRYARSIGAGPDAVMQVVRK